MQSILQEMPDAALRVLVVWEPILMTDRLGVKPAAIERIRDSRVTQYWDAKHTLSAQMGGPGHFAHNPRSKVLFRMGKYVWDFVAVYPAGARWGNSPPGPVFSGGAVVNIQDDLRRELAQAVKPR